MVDVALALGSNLGDRSQNICKAVTLLQENGFQLDVVSEMMSSEPVDCPDGSGEFLNGALTGRWHDSCRALMELCQEIERKLGRPGEREINAPRPVDLDILLFGNEIYDERDLKVPHVRMLERDFVMLPLNEIASNWQVPGTENTVGELSQVFL